MIEKKIHPLAEKLLEVSGGVAFAVLHSQQASDIIEAWLRERVQEYERQGFPMLGPSAIRKFFSIPSDPPKPKKVLKAQAVVKDVG